MPPSTSTASGTATLTLNANQDALAYSITLTGVDLDGLQTPETEDDVTGMHIHIAPADLNGPLVFGILGLVDPEDPVDLVVSDELLAEVTGAVTTGGGR